MVRSGSTKTRPARSSGTPSVWASGEAATPAAQRTVRAWIRSGPIQTPSASIPVTWTPVQTATPSVSSCLRAAADRSSVYAPRTRGLASTRITRAEAVLMWRKSCARVCRVTSASVPASSTPVGPAPTITKVIQARRRDFVRLALGDLERHQHPPADLQGVLQGLQAGSMLGPVVMAEISMGRAGGDDQDVVIDRAVGQHDPFVATRPRPWRRPASRRRSPDAGRSGGSARRCRPG